jgi:hypothetical protein
LMKAAEKKQRNVPPFGPDQRALEFAGAFEDVR